MNTVDTKMNQIKLLIKDIKNVPCDACGSETFNPVIILKRLPAIASPTGQESLVPIQVFSCQDCGHINEEFLREVGEINTGKQEGELSQDPS